MLEPVAQYFEQFAHFGRREQVGRVGGNAAGRKYPKIGQSFGLQHGLLAAKFTLQNVAEAFFVRHAHGRRDAWFAEVSVNDQSANSALRERQA